MSVEQEDPNMLTTSLRNLVRTALVVSSLAAFAAPAFAFQPIGSYGLWTSGVEGSGRERVCGITTEMSRGGRAGLITAGGKLHLVLWQQGWNFARKDGLLVRVKVDGESFSGTARAEGHVIFAENLSGSFLDAFLSGHELKIDVAGQAQWTLDLSGAQAAARDMARCTTQASS
jgi:hypothetical protein